MAHAVQEGGLGTVGLFGCCRGLQECLVLLDFPFLLLADLLCDEEGMGDSPLTVLLVDEEGTIVPVTVQGLVLEFYSSLLAEAFGKGTYACKFQHANPVVFRDVVVGHQAHYLLCLAVCAYHLLYLPVAADFKVGVCFDVNDIYAVKDMGHRVHDFPGGSEFLMHLLQLLVKRLVVPFGLFHDIALSVFMVCRAVPLWRGCAPSCLPSGPGIMYSV